MPQDFTTSPTDLPLIVQFGASSPIEIGRATELIAPHVSGVDLNCGCPQSWACAESLGAALMHKRSLVASMVTSIRSTLSSQSLLSSKSVSVKIRIHKNLRETVDFVKTVEAAGVDFITVHGRTRAQRSSESVNLDAIKLIKSIATVPVIANGDVFSLSDAHRIASETGVDGVMAARGILENPALFAGYETCPWDAVEKFMNHVVRKPIPYRLVQHHISEMTGGAMGMAKEGGLLSKRERAELFEITDMLNLVDFLDEKRGVRRF
jgi:tRNA-dihydrouridine synthase 4